MMTKYLLDFMELVVCGLAISGRNGTIHSCWHSITQKDVYKNIIEFLIL